MKKSFVFLMAIAVAATAAYALPKKGVRKGAQNGAVDATETVTTGRGAKVNITQAPLLGQGSCLNAPSLQGASVIGQCYKKPRQWIVLETKYTTFGTETSRFLDQLTFTWHVLLETKSAKENKGNKEGFAPYSYFSTAVSYFNIPSGDHGACVCLPPSYLERFGEAKAVGFSITNQNGEELAGDCWSEVKGIASHKKFWENQDIMSATDKTTGKPMIERRQGLVDRSKTIWALVNPNDYEATMQ